MALDQTGETLVDERFRMAPSALWLQRLEEGTIVVMDQDEMVALSGSPLARQLADEGLRSLLSAPLIFQGQPLGSLNLAADTPGYFTDEHREIVAEIVSQLAAAIGQEQLRDDLVRSTEALRISEARFRTAVEEAPLPMIIHAEDGEVITLNRIWTELTGYAHADIPTIKDWTRRAYGDLHQAMEAVIERLYDLDEPRAEGEFAITCLDGTERIWDFSSTPLGRLPDGRRIELSMAADVTERRRAEVAQRRRLAELAALFNVASGLRTLHLAEEAWAVLLSETIVALDVEGGAGAVWLPRASTGKLHAEVTQGWMERLLDIPLAPTEGIVGAAFTTGLEQQSADWANDPAEHAAVAAQIPAGSGAYFVPIWAEEGVSGVLAIAGPSGADLADQQVQLLASVAEMAGAYLDRARLWQQLRDQAQLTQQIIDTIPESVIVLDQEHQLVLANPAARTTFPDISGLQPGDFLTDIDGEPPAAFLAPTAVGEPWTEAMLGDPPRSFEVASQPLIGGYHDGGWVLVLRDVTEEHERQRYLLAQERLATVGQLAAGIAHDFNNIMGTISLYVELVQNEQNLTDAQQRHLGVISEQTRNAARLIRQIMDFSRHSDIELKPVNLASLFGETFELLQRTLPDNVALELRSSGARSFVEGDPVRLQQALMNLILNARDAMPAGGRLTLTLSNLVVADADTAPLPDMPAGVWVVIEVTDTGSGIAPDHLTHLFEPFFTTKGPTKGTGLGLAQVYGIVKQHNGSIDVRSESGQGTTFTIYIPLVEPIRQSESDRSVAEPVPQGSETVLLVEDNAALRMAVAEMLTSLGYHVWEAEDGAQALARFEREQDTIQLILSDLGMPRMDGFELYARVQELNPQIKMIIMSGYLPEQHERMLDQENLAWIEKPFEIEELAHKMRSLLQSAPG